MEEYSSKQKTTKLPGAAKQAHIPPNSSDAERSLLGGLILDNKSWDYVADKIVEVDFYQPHHRALFQAISRLASDDKPFDLLTLTDTLESMNQLEQAGGETYILELVNATPSAANVSAYADIVRERSSLRQLLEVAQGMVQLTFNPEGRSAKELLDESERRLFAIADGRAATSEGPIGINQIMATTTERIDTLYHSKSALTGLETGFSDLDKMTAGLQAGDLVIVAGRPSMGKTVLGLNMAEHAAITGDKPVLVFSIEMPSELLAMRMLSSLGRVDQNRIRTGQLTDEDWPRVTSAVTMLSKAKLFIDDSASMGPVEMRARARRLARKHGPLGLIVVDYLQLMHMPGYGDNRTLEISEISRLLKAIAREFNVPVIACSQLNRSLEQRQDKRPVMSDLRESGAIEQDADVIAFIYRDEVYNKDSPDKGTAEIIIGKQRNGPIGKIRLTFLGEFTRFENYTSNDVMAMEN